MVGYDPLAGLSVGLTGPACVHTQQGQAQTPCTVVPGNLEVQSSVTTVRLCSRRNCIT
jgi:hypothetical protein